jgi:uncharacterized protein YgiM (DUF1202 family)
MRLKLSIILLVIAQIACLDTSLTPSALSAGSSPPFMSETPQPQPSEEIESGEVYELKAEIQLPTAQMCVTAIEAVHLRAEPHHKSRVINWLRAGTQVTARRTADGWTYAEVGQQSGYIKSEFLGECAE